MEKSPAAARASRRSICSHGVSRSDREITQKSCISGAPSTAAPESAEVTPGTTSTSAPPYSPASCKSGPAMPYTPASPLHTSATVRPAAAVSSAQRQRSSSRVMGVTYVSLPGYRCFTKSTYTV